MTHAPPSGITFADKASVDVGAAALLIDLFELNARLLARLKLPPHRGPVLAVRRDLEQFLTYAAAYDVSTNVTSTHQPLPSSSELLTPNDAAPELGIQPAGVRWLCRNRRLGRKVGNRWLISREDVDMYRKNRTKDVT
jgi:hypothetical protein